MDDADLVCGFQGFGDLAADVEHFVDGAPAVACQQVRQGRSFDQFEHEHLCAARVLQSVDRADVRMIQRGEDLRFAAESRTPASGRGRTTLAAP